MTLQRLYEQINQLTEISLDALTLGDIGQDFFAKLNKLIELSGDTSSSNLILQKDSNKNFIDYQSSENKLIISGKTKDRLLGLHDLDCILEFSGIDPPFLYQLTIKFPTNWKIIDSFPPFSKTEFSLIEFKNFELNITNDPSLNLSRSEVNLVGTIQLLDSVINTFNSVSFPHPVEEITGQIVKTENEFQIVLHSRLEGEPSISFLDLELQFRESSFSLYTSVWRTGQVAVQTKYIDSSILVRDGSNRNSGNDIEMPLRLQLPTIVSGWFLSMQPEQTKTLSDFSDFLLLLSSAGTFRIEDILPNNFSSPLREIELTSLMVNLSNNLSFEKINFSISTTEKWMVFSELELSDLQFGFGIRKHNSDFAVSGAISGIVDIGGIALLSNISLPPGSGSWIFSSIHDIEIPGFHIFNDLLGGTAIAELLPASLGDLDGFILTNLRIIYDSKNNAFQSCELSVTNQKSWAIIPNRFTAKSLSIQLQAGKKSGGEWSAFGNINGELLIGNISVSLLVQKVSADADWHTYLNTSRITLPSLDDFSELVGGKNLVDGIVPKSLLTTHLYLSDLNVALNISHKRLESLHFTLTMDEIDFDVLKLNEASASVQFNFLPPTNRSARITGRLTIEKITGDESTSKANRGDLDIYITSDYATGSGWQIEGQSGNGQVIPIGHLAEYLAEKFITPQTPGSSQPRPLVLPEPIRTLTLKNLAVSYNTQSKDFIASGAADFTINDFLVYLSLVIENQHQQNGAFQKTIQGHITIDPLQFDLIFDKDENSKVMLAAYHDAKGTGVSLSQLLSNIGVTDVPDVLAFTIKDAALIHEATESGSTQTSKNLFLAHIDAGINLSGLPLIGKQFSADKKVELTFQVLYASYSSTDAAGDEIAKINGLLPTEINQLQLKEIKQGPSVATTLRWGRELISIALPIDANDDQTGGTTEPLQADSSVPQANSSTRNSVSSDQGTWIDVQKKLGPVHLNRIGVQYQDQKVWMLFDASLALGGLTIGLEGLGVGSRLTKIDPQFTLHGIAIDYQKETVEIGASLLRGVYDTDAQGNSVPEYEEYDGIATLKMEQLSIAAIGSYTTIDDEASLFVYALINKAIGGPSFFFITGLAVGFGYNRDLLIPPVEELTSFPLIAQAIRGDGLPANADRTNLLQELETLHSYLTPKTDRYFLAVGVKFTTFKIVDSFALVTLSFGKQFSFNLLGLSTLLVPPSMEGEHLDKDPLSEIQVALRATYVPETGVLKIDARLTPNSYILSRQCRLTGGFAFYSWFKGHNAGDFVVTLGGYHPHFHVPDHYPIVPRLAFNWPVDSHTNIKGDMYFALCPHALMAGGHLAATYHAGPLDAWFTIGADFLISWKPYHYDAEIYVSMGGSFTYHFFGTHHISVHLGADLHVWGPDFGGHAKIHLWVVSIGVSFGDQSSQDVKALTWEEFRDSFLPQKEQMVSLQVAKGLVTRGDTDDDLGVINPKHLVITTDSVIPSNAVSLLNEDKANESQDKTISIGQPAIGPMEIDTNLLQTKHTVTIEKLAPELIAPEALKEHFSFHPILKKVPAALWGNKLSPDVNGEHFVAKALTGFRIAPAAPPRADRTRTIDKSKLRFDLSPIPDAFQWETESSDERAIALESKEQMNAMQNDPNRARDSLLQALNMSSEDLDFSQSPGNNFLYVSTSL